MLLLNFVHQPANNPYRASHAIFIREAARQAFDRTDDIPDVLRVRTLSLRAYDHADSMIDADLIDGAKLASKLDQILTNPAVHYIHAHFAKRGCFAARIDRA